MKSQENPHRVGDITSPADPGQRERFNHNRSAVRLDGRADCSASEGTRMTGIDRGVPSADLIRPVSTPGPSPAAATRVARI